VLLFVALLECVLLWVVGKRYYDRRHSGDRNFWQWCRILLILCVVGVIWDCTRFFLGGFYGEIDDFDVEPNANNSWIEDDRDKTYTVVIPTEKAPGYAAMLYPLLALHLGVVPVVACVAVEIAIATKNLNHDGTNSANSKWVDDSQKEKIVRIAVFVVACAIGLIGFINAFSEVAVTEDFGYEWSQKFGVAVFRTRNGTFMLENGYVYIEGMELTGVVYFGFGAFLTSIYVWQKTNWLTYAVVSFVALLGQAIGGVSSDYFFYASNAWELVSFGLLVWADFRFFNQIGSEPTDLSWKALLFPQRMTTVSELRLETKANDEA